MTSHDKAVSGSRIPLVSGAVVAVRSRPYLAYLLGLLALGLGLYVWKMEADDAKALRAAQDKLVRLEARLVESQHQQQRLSDALDLKSQQLDEVSTRLARLDDTLNTAQRRAWLLKESDYYLHLAQQHLLVTRDAVGARALLEVADRLLAEHGDNSLLPLRQALAKDRMALSSTPDVDVPGIHLRLEALSEHMGGLPLALPGGERVAQRGEVVPPDAQPSGPLETGWAKIRSLITIRHYDEPIRPLLSTADRALVREALQMNIAQAQLALLRREPAIYRSSLTAARNTLARYFSLLPQAEYKGLLQELNALAALDIRPALPDLASLRALEALSSPPSTKAMP